MLTSIASDFFAKSPLLALPVIAMAIFMTVFTLGAVRTFRTDKKKLDEVANLPFAHEEEVRHG